MLVLVKSGIPMSVSLSRTLLIRVLYSRPSFSHHILPLLSGERLITVLTVVVMHASISFTLVHFVNVFSFLKIVAVDILQSETCLLFKLHLLFKFLRQPSIFLLHFQFGLSFDIVHIIESDHWLINGRQFQHPFSHSLLEVSLDLVIV